MPQQIKSCLNYWAKRDMGLNEKVVDKLGASRIL